MSKTTKTNTMAILIVVGVLSALAVLGLVVYGLWALVSSQSRNAADWWAVVATLLIAPAFFIGFWFGKTEVRGFLSGADKMLDRMSTTIERTVAIRDNSRIAVHNARRAGSQPNYTVVLPNVTNAPPITHRELTSGDKTIDL
jgi:flagellar basal body-associated protein FliL